MLRKFILSLAAAALIMPSSVDAGYSYDYCNKWANQLNITYSGSMEMSLTGCVYSKSKRRYVARSNKCNAMARKLAYRNNRLVGTWELARQVNRYYSDCETTARGVYYID